MLQSFKEEGRAEGLERGMMRADREVLSVLFASRFDPGTVRLLNEAAEAIADPKMLHSATHDAVRSKDKRRYPSAVRHCPKRLRALRTFPAGGTGGRRERNPIAG